jgi:spore germination protein YaaH
MTTCPFGHQAAGLSPHCDTANGPVWFEDAASMTEKVQAAKSHGLLGVAYYTVGGEPSGFFSAMTAQYPNQ